MGGYGFSKHPTALRQNSENRPASFSSLCFLKDTSRLGTAPPVHYPMANNSWETTKKKLVEEKNKNKRFTPNNNIYSI
jgi:hypothetical protein